MVLRDPEVAEAVDMDETEVVKVVSLQVVVGTAPVPEFETDKVVLLVVTSHGLSLAQLEPDCHGPLVLLNVGYGGEADVDVADVTPDDPVPRLADVELSPPVPVKGRLVAVVVVESVVEEDGQIVPI